MTRLDDAPNAGWPYWASAAPPRDLKKREFQFRHFSAWMVKNVSHLWSGDSNLAYTPEILEQQLSNLLATSTDLQTHRIFANWWDMLLAEGHRLKRWNLRPGSQRVRLQPERSAFVRRDFQLLSQFRLIETAFHQRLCGALEPAQRHDAFLLSAVMNGGILSIESLSALLSLRADAIQMHNGAMWATLDLPAAGSAKGRPLRWYPDALTATLLTKLLEHGPPLRRQEMAAPTARSFGPVSRRASFSSSSLSGVMAGWEACSGRHALPPPCRLRALSLPFSQTTSKAIPCRTPSLREYSVRDCRHATPLRWNRNTPPL